MSNHQSTDICSIAAIIFKTWHFTTLPNFKLQGNIGSNQRKFVAPTSYLGFLGVLFWVSLLGIYVKALYVEESGSFTFDSDLVELCILFVENILIIILCHKNKKYIGSIPGELLQNERLLTNITKEIRVDNSGVKVLGIALIKYILLCINGFIEYINIPDNRVNIATYYFAWGFQFHSELILILYFLVLNQQFRKLNNYVKNDKYSLNCHQLKTAMQIHSRLRDSINLIKKGFNGFILLKILANLSMTSTGIFYTIQVKFGNKEQHLLASLISDAAWLMLIIIVDFALIIIFDTILEKDRMLKNNINEIVNKMKSKLPYKEYAIFNLDRYVNEFEFMVCGLFPLNCKVICWTVSGVSTYVIYLMQSIKK